jgi:hypothetical protein
LPRTRKTKEAETDQQAEEKKRKARPKKEKFVDPIELLNEYWSDVINALGLSSLGLTEEEYKELIKEPFSGAVGEVKTKPKVSTIIGRLNANREDLFAVLATKLATMKDPSEMNDAQLEFVVFYVKEAIKGLGPRLYEECKKRKRQDLIDYLRAKWSQFGINSPVKCPRCGFQAVMPDYVCYICRYQVPEREVKNQIGVPQILIEYSKIDPAGFREIYTAGYFYYGWQGIIPPSRARGLTGELIFEIVLSKSDKEALKPYYTGGKAQGPQG